MGLSLMDAMVHTSLVPELERLLQVMLCGTVFSRCLLSTVPRRGEVMHQLIELHFLVCHESANLVPEVE